MFAGETHAVDGADPITPVIMPDKHAETVPVAGLIGEMVLQLSVWQHVVVAESPLADIVLIAVQEAVQEYAAYEIPEFVPTIFYFYSKKAHSVESITYSMHRLYLKMF